MIHFINSLLESTLQFQFENSLYKIQSAKKVPKLPSTKAYLAHSKLCHFSEHWNNKIAVEHTLIRYYFFRAVAIHLNIGIKNCQSVSYFQCKE